MLAAIASISVQSIRATQPNPAHALAMTDPLAGTKTQRAEEARHAAATVAAVAPAAMNALLSAQEHMQTESSAISRARAVREIDHIIAQVTGAPALAVTTPGADFSLARLMTARQQLRETYA